MASIRQKCLCKKKKMSKLPRKLEKELKGRRKPQQSKQPKKYIGPKKFRGLVKKFSRKDIDMVNKGLNLKKHLLKL